MSKLESVKVTLKPREGKTLAFAWGPPWNWRPSFERSKYHAGWSLTWFWWGLYWLPYSLGSIMHRGVYPRCSECALHVFDPTSESRPYYGKETDRFICKWCEEETTDERQTGSY